MLLDLRKRDVKFVSFEAGDQFLHGGTGSDPVYINIGMQTEKFTVRRNIYRIRVTVIEDICHDFLQYTDFISLGIQIQKFTLLRVGKVINSGEILEYGFLQKLLNLATVQGIFIQCIPPGRVFRHSLQIGGYLRDIGELEDFLELIHGSKPALHCADFRGKSAVGEYASHCFSLPFLMSSSTSFSK